MPTRRPRLDALEDRTVPAGYDPVTGIGFDSAGRQFIALTELPDPSLLPSDPPQLVPRISLLAGSLTRRMAFTAGSISPMARTAAS